MSFNTNEVKGAYPDLVFPYQEAVPDALLANPLFATIAGNIEGDKPYIRVPYMKTDPNAGFVKEGAVIQDGGGALDEVLITTGKIATIVTQSNESASFNQASQLIAAGVSRSIINAADNAILNNPKADNAETQNGPVGLLNTEGLATATVTPEKATGAVNGLVDAVAKMKATIGTNGGTPTAIIVNPVTESLLRTLHTSDGGSLLIDPTRADALSLHGLPIIVNKAMPDNKLFMVSASEIVAAAGSVTLAVSTDVLFNSDSLVRRATWRIGAKPVHANRLGLITVQEAQ